MKIIFLVISLIIFVSGCTSPVGNRAGNDSIGPKESVTPAPTLASTSTPMPTPTPTPASKPRTFDPSKETIPKFVRTDFTELDKIDRISKFRSGYGHDFSYGTGEICRSMKHYYWQKGGMPGKSHDPSWTSVKYYSPVNGTVAFVFYGQNQTGGKEAQFYIQSLEYPAFYFSFFHVNLFDSIRMGTKVTAGQHIGYVGDEDAHAEIAVEVRTPSGSALLSFFEVMDSSLFEQYKKRGAGSINDFIIGKAERDSKPLVCDPSTEEGRFIGGSQDGLRDSAGLETFFELN